MVFSFFYAQIFSARCIDIVSIFLMPNTNTTQHYNYIQNHGECPLHKLFCLLLLLPFFLHIIKYEYCFHFVAQIIQTDLPAAAQDMKTVSAALYSRSKLTAACIFHHGICGYAKQLPPAMIKCNQYNRGIKTWLQPFI